MSWQNILRYIAWQYFNLSVLYLEDIITSTVLKWQCNIIALYDKIILHITYNSNHGTGKKMKHDKESMAIYFKDLCSCTGI